MNRFVFVTLLVALAPACSSSMGTDDPDEIDSLVQSPLGTTSGGYDGSQKLLDVGTACFDKCSAGEKAFLNQGASSWTVQHFGVIDDKGNYWTNILTVQASKYDPNTSDDVLPRDAAYVKRVGQNLKVLLKTLANKRPDALKLALDARDGNINVAILGGGVKDHGGCSYSAQGLRCVTGAESDGLIHEFGHLVDLGGLMAEGDRNAIYAYCGRWDSLDTGHDYGNPCSVHELAAESYMMMAYPTRRAWIEAHIKSDGKSGLGIWNKLIWYVPAVIPDDIRL